MSQTINRMFDSHERATQAAEALRNNRFDGYTEVYVVNRFGGPEAGSGAAELSVDGIVAALMKAYVLKAHAKVFAERIKLGGALVTVHARFGSAVSAIDILDRHGPVESGVPDFRDAPMAWDDAAPCSSIMHMPVLLADSATFSKFWNVPALLKRAATTFSAFGLPEIVKSSGPYSGMLGMPLISNKATILSSMLGMPVLKKSKAARH
jgi:hypothetical protein